MAKRKYVKENNLVKAINTDSLELQKPLVNEYYDINVHNSNMDKIDKGYKQNKNDISSINSELSKTENTSYITENGVKEFECKDGYVDNVVIEGQTLVNLVDFDVSRANSDGITIRTYFKSVDRVSNGTYTLFNNNDKEMFFVTSKISTGEYVGGYTVFPNTPYLLELDSDRQCYGIDFGITSVGWVDDASWYTNSNVKAIILEGDHTDKPISYFEGLKSVGQGDKIEVLTYDNVIINLFNGGLQRGYFSSDDGSFVSQQPGNAVGYCNSTPIDISQKKSLHLNLLDNRVYSLSESFNVFYYDSSFSFICSENISYNKKLNIPNNAKFLNFKFNTSAGGSSDYTDLNIALTESPIKQDKKQILTTLRSLPNGVKDTIEKRGNKYVKVQRCGEIVIDGNESVDRWGNFFINSSNTKTKAIGLKIDGVLKENGGNLYCDKYTHKKVSELGDNEGCYMYPGSNGHVFYIQVLNSKADKTTFLNDLKTNPITIVVQLATPIIEELPNFNPQTFSDKTTLLLNSGAVQGEASFEVTNSLGSELEVLKGKVSDLDDNYVRDIPIQYLNGWSGDLVCKVENKQVTIQGMLHGQDAGVKSARTFVLKLPIDSKAIQITAIGLHNAFGQYIGAVELTQDNEIRICHSDLTYNGNYIGLNLSWYLH